MTSDLYAEDMSLGPGVVETIISLTAHDVEGVASVGSFTINGLRQVLQHKANTAGIEVEVDDHDKLHVTLHIDVYYGYVLPQLAANLRQAIADAIKVQVGLEVSAVDIYIDGIQFAA
ncbi:MAG: Asp23/Gls24 family envelope stress response protein [Eggerthellaceae bacterium]|nr:Asp23/Gls24 family envelope stress response protein [Eggerthellaceae bacterium]